MKLLRLDYDAHLLIINHFSKFLFLAPTPTRVPPTPIHSPNEDTPGTSASATKSKKAPPHSLAFISENIAESLVRVVVSPFLPLN